MAPTSVTAVEGGADGFYTVRLGSRPAGAVTVTATSDHAPLEVDTDATKLTRKLTFSTSTWNTPQTVTVSAADDPDAVAEWATITHAATGSGYDGVSGPNVRATAQDDDATGTNYDVDADGLIEIDTLAQLDAVRHDLDGDGVATSTATAAYAAAFSSAAAGMGCPDGPDPDDAGDCRGYELTADLNFDTDSDGVTHTDGVGDPRRRLLQRRLGLGAHQRPRRRRQRRRTPYSTSTLPNSKATATSSEICSSTGPRNNMLACSECSPPPSASIPWACWTATCGATTTWACWRA